MSLTCVSFRSRYDRDVRFVSALMSLTFVPDSSRCDRDFSFVSALMSLTFVPDRSRDDRDVRLVSALMSLTCVKDRSRDDKDPSIPMLFGSLVIYFHSIFSTELSIRFSSSVAEYPSSIRMSKSYIS